MRGSIAPARVQAPDYSAVIEAFAREWHLSGYAVPPDYASPDGQPTTQAGKARQVLRGQGDGSTLSGVRPYSLDALPPRLSTVRASAVLAAAIGAAVPVTRFASMGAQGLMLCMVA
eukprot:4691105-Pleurochrysis_carterae.AAC.1